MRRTLRIAPLAVFAAALLAWGCDDTAPTDGSDTDVIEATAGCTSAVDCTGAEEGLLCAADGACVACSGDSDCLLEPAYATTRPRCIEGVCSACPDGDLECACLEDDTCDQGECVEGTCTDCRRGDLGCVCRANGTCEAGAVCDDGSGLCAACTDGVEGCPCDNGSCGEGLVCESDMCVLDTCVPGALECPCDSGACTNPDAYCDESDLCQACSSDVPGCPCDVGDTCEGDNYCDTAEDACLACPETDKPLTCGCTGNAECAVGLVCDGEDSVCRDAITCDLITCGDFQLCDASAGDAFCAESCEEGYMWDAGTGACVVIPDPQTCLDGNGDPTTEGQACLDADQACVVENDLVICVDTCATLDCGALFRDCTPGASETESATCGDCTVGYEEVVDPDDDTKTICEPSTTANCSPGGSDSIAELCASRFQICVETADGATCGACLAGRVFDPSLNSCVENTTCGATFCAADEYCFFSQDGSAPRCESRCPEGEAYDPDGGACTSCALDCGAGTLYGALVEGQCACTSDVFCSYHTDGSDPRCQLNPCSSPDEAADPTGACSTCGISCTTGSVAGRGSRIWPWRTPTGECVCETLEGYYLPYGENALPALCDADGDGWIKETAEQVWDVATGSTTDAVALSNFRCERREIDRVRLRNEYGQIREVGVCDGELYDWAPGDVPAICSGAPDVMVLQEPDILDSDNQVVQNATELPAYGSRVFKASELNAMTKACNTLEADYNLNGREDLLEVQPLKLTDMTWNTSATPEEFFYASMSYFTELHTARFTPRSGNIGVYTISERSRCEGFPLTYDVGPDFYWESCLRLRDAAYDETGDRAGMDFAPWSCDATSGTCALPAPDGFNTGQNLDGDAVIDHDLCAMRAIGQLPLANEPWLGMSHHSQFKCVQVSSGSGGHEMNRVDIRGGGGTPTYDFNACDVGGSQTQGDTLQPRVPQITCAEVEASVANVPDDSVGFAAALFQNTDRGLPYARGCINESFGTAPDVTPPSVEDGNGWSRLCPGFVESGVCYGTNCTTATLTSGNAADFGKLVCGCDFNYSGAGCSVGCTTNGLHLGSADNDGLTAAERAEYLCLPVEESTYCRLHAPTETFSGGTRGAWLCGEFTQTRPTDTTTGSVLSGTVGGQSAELHGNVRAVSVQRTPLEQDPSNPGTGFTLY